MVRHRLLTAGLAILGLAVASVPALAADPPAPKKSPLLFTPPPEGAEEQALAEQIDKLIAAEWAKKGITPARPTDDAEFLRRAYLDIAGRIPHNSTVRKFLEDPSPDKRSRVISELLGSAKATNNFTSFWRNQLIPQNNNQFAQNFAFQLDPWLIEKIRSNTPYNEVVREILTAPLNFNLAGGGLRPPGAVTNQGPLAFYQANESKPENLAAATSRLFLGIRLECAQCHDHPFAKWTREDFWGYAAFFAGVSPQQADQPQFSPTIDRPDVREIKIPGAKEKIVQARFLDGKEPQWKDGVPTRVTLANWMTSKDNPYFAKAAVNRVWAHFFGIGIIDPVDEPADDNPPSHPELLDLLAKSFVDHNYDLRFLMGAIARSKAYQLTSAMSDPSQMDPRLFARMSLKGVTAEQFFDSLALAVGYDDKTPRNLRDFAGPGQNSPRAEFLNKFSNFADKRTEFQTSILQALALMNGSFTDDATKPSDADGKFILAGAVQDMPFATTEKRIEALFLSTLSRKPTAKELEKLTAYVDEGGPAKDPKKALGDVFWALLNSSEFILNH